MAILDTILNFLHSAMGMSAVIAIAAEMLVRMWPTASKASIFVPIIRKAGEIVVAFADLLDKVLPQNVKAVEPPQA